MRDYFFSLADFLMSLLQRDEAYLAGFSGEDSDFVRFNKSAIRQAGSVSQRYLNVDWIRGQRHAAGTLTLSGDMAEDQSRLHRLVTALRERLPLLPEDPHLLYSTDVRSSSREGINKLPSPDAAIEAILAAGKGRDLVGIWASGGIFAGFANSLGQRNWYSTHSFNLDWSFYYEKDKAVKSMYAGFEWDTAAFNHKLESASRQLAGLAKPPRTIEPGKYRVYFAPAAVEGLLDMLSWGFGLKAVRTKQTVMLKMITEGAKLNTGFTLKENTKDGVAPNFQAQGFIRPDQVTLVEAGAFKDCLVCPRSAKEYGVPTNGADGSEAPSSADLAPGTLPLNDVLKTLNTGLYVGNVWYTNYSDLSAARITGMTRFATFWVENGEIVAPLNVMRFDETLFNIFGANLIALTQERELLMSASTYGGRNTSSSRVPGAVVEAMTFTL